jgi:two-component system chemotaxis response regulator CheY
MEDSILYIKVLIVDDHALSREVTGDALRKYNVQKILNASDGQIAQTMIERAKIIGEPFDIVFLDWDMPVMPGIDVLKHFRALPEYSNTAFIMLTAAARQGDVMEAIKAGANTYIIKPVSRDAIGKRFMEIVEWVRKKRLE